MTLPRMALAAVLLTGCAHARSGSGSGQPVQTFPQRSELAQMAAATRPDGPLLPDVISVETWDVQSEIPLQDGPVTSAAPEATLLSEVASQAQVSPSAAVHCLAQELARVVHQTGHLPDTGLHRYLAARCGAQAQAEVRYFSFTVPDSVPIETLLEQERARLVKEFASIGGEGRHVGLGLSRAGGKGVLLYALVRPQVALERFDRTLDAQGRMVLEGRTLGEAAGITALINRGEYGVAACMVDPSRPLPAFRVVCEAAPEDDSAWVQLAVTPPGRVLANIVLEALPVRTPEAARSFTRRTGTLQPVADEAAFRKGVLTLVNERRAQASLRPLVLSDAQSAFVSSLVRPLFEAHVASGDEADVASSQLTLGMMAGWDVSGGTIQNANVVSVYQAMEPDAARWVHDATSVPMGRMVLLDPKAHVLALGAEIQAEPAQLAAVAVGYAFHEPEAKPGLDAKALLERLAKVRAARGLGETVMVDGMVGMNDALGNIEHTKATPFEALEFVMHDVSRATGRSVQGLVWETHDLDNIEFPPILLRRGRLMLGAGVTFYRPLGGAWGQYSVLFVVLDVPDGGEA